MTLLSEKAIFLSTAPPRTCPEDAIYPLPHRFNRLLSSTVFPVRIQNRLRDNGWLRVFVDTCVKLAVPTMALGDIKSAVRFFQLSYDVVSVQYGRHDHQRIELFFPNKTNERGFVYFIHGGAWGSGRPWMYRLISLPFLEIGLAVAVVGYRTYPDGSVEHQIEDLGEAFMMLENKYFRFMKEKHKYNDNWLGKILIGHSSGAHIGLLFIIRQIQTLLQRGDTKVTEGFNFDIFLGLSGVYSIPHHFDFERWRGVEEISPMKPACGHHNDSFEHHSPTVSLFKSMTSWSSPVDKLDLSTIFPSILLVHGVEDSTVPFTSSADAAYMMRSLGIERCYEYYIPGADHQDTIMDLMVGGITRKICTEFITSKAAPKFRLIDMPIIQSRL